MKKIAITGNIASGKSQVENFIAKYYPVYDTDEIAHKILNEITEFYGLDVFTNKKIDRKKLGDLVFNNLELKQKLEALIHPKIKKELERIFRKHINDKFVFISIPLLFEVGWEYLFDEIILITADDSIRLSRLMQRNNFTEESALQRIKAQIAQEDKVSKADYIIENNTTKEDLHNKIENLLANFI